MKPVVEYKRKKAGPEKLVERLDASKKEQRPVGHYIGILERRLGYLEGLIQKGPDNPKTITYNLGEANALRHAISALLRYRAEYRSQIDLVNLIEEAKDHLQDTEEGNRIRGLMLEFLEDYEL